MSASRDHAAVQRTYDYVNAWPEALQDAFWAAVNAPTYAQSAEKTLAFATTLAHELAEKIRAHNWEGPCAVGCCTGDTPDAAADLIDPEVT